MIARIAVAVVFVTLFACTRPPDAATVYARGEYKQAMDLWRPLAEAGDPEAQYALGYMYRNGQGVPASAATAFDWYMKAAEQGLAKAQVKTALMYAKGDGVDQSNVLAYLWFDLAARNGDTKSAQARDLMARRMTAEDIEEANRLARNWRPK